MKVQNEEELLAVVTQNIQESDKQNVPIIAGHFPLVFEHEGAREDLNIWGVFSKYSLELGVKIGQVAIAARKTPRFLFLADDHTYRGWTGLGGSAEKTRINQFYKGASGTDGVVHPELAEIIAYGGFSTNDVARHNHRKPGRTDCLYFSENVLRDFSSGSSDNACAREYVTLIERTDYVNKDLDHLVSFIPNRCKGHIADIAMDELITGLEATHIFMETGNPFARRAELYSGLRGVTLRRD